MSTNPETRKFQYKIALESGDDSGMTPDEMWIIRLF